MKSILTALFLVCVMGTSAQSGLVVESSQVPFRVALDGVAVTDSASLLLRMTIHEQGPHLLDIVFEDESQSTISRTIRTEDRTEVHYLATSADAGSFVPLFLVRFSPDDASSDTLRYRGIPTHSGRPVVCHFPVSDVTFRQLMSEFREKEFDFQREAGIKQALKTRCFTTKQLRALFGLIEFEDKRLELMPLILNCCTDLESAHKLEDLFVFEMSKRQFLDSIK